MANKFSYTDRNNKTWTVDWNNTGFLGLKGDDYKVNNAFGMAAGQTKHVNQAVKYLIENGKVPTAEFLGLEEGSNAYANVLKDVETWKSKNPEFTAEYEKSIREAAEAEASELDSKSDYYLDVTEIDQAGTLANDMYNTYIDLGKMHKQSMAGQEAKMQQELVANRAALLDQIRNDRRTKLKSGLSSSQIANEELQYMMAGNQQAQNITQSYYDQARSHDINFSDAGIRSSMYNDIMPGYLSAGSAYAASSATDMYEQAQRYAKANNVSVGYAYDHLINSQKS